MMLFQKKANVILGCINRIAICKAFEGIILPCSAPEDYIQFWALHYRPGAGSLLPVEPLVLAYICRVSVAFGNAHFPL